MKIVRPGEVVCCKLADAHANAKKVTAELIRIETNDVGDYNQAYRDRGSLTGIVLTELVYKSRGRGEMKTVVSTVNERNGLEIVVPVPVDAVPSFQFENAKIEYLIQIKVEGNKLPTIPIKVISDESQIVPRPLIGNESIMMKSCFCAKIGQISVCIEGPTELYKQSSNYTFNLSFDGTGLRKVEKIEISIGGTLHVETTNTLEIVPGRGKCRVNFSPAAFLVGENLKPNQKYPISFYKVESTVLPHAEGKIVRFVPTITVLITCGICSTTELEFPIQCCP